MTVAIKGEIMSEQIIPAIGDTIVVVDAGDNCKFYSKGDLGIVMQFAPDGDILVDFNEQGNLKVIGKGRWYVGDRETYSVIKQPVDKPQEQKIEMEPSDFTSATDFLRKAASLQESRAAEYDQEGGERSAGKIAQAFNAITGHSLTESDVWMLLVVLKQVRFYNNPANKHRDSVEDLVSYSALFAESVFSGRQ